jgi:hypothetical protein
MGTPPFLRNFNSPFIQVILSTPALHSQTNYFLASLAVSDLLLILVGIPFDIFFLWRRKSIVPPFNGFCETTSESISIIFSGIIFIHSQVHLSAGLLSIQS